ncbi:MAG: CAP domain-containing protein [Anaerolineae bacterium]|nr:CAP domain-containing protein [Anaerolineae bacterium]
MSDVEPLRVTAEDIESQGERVTAPPVLTIRPDEVPDALPPAPTRSGHLLLITPEDIAAFEPAGEDVTSVLERMMFDRVNLARSEHIPKWLGRGPLQWHPGLAGTARQHSADMLERRYVAHNTPEGLTVSQRLDRSGISYLACGENIGVIYGPASHGERGVNEVHMAFMNQPRRLTNHRGNILNPVWTHVGIGVAYAPEGQLIVTQNFIATFTKPV